MLLLIPVVSVMENPPHDKVTAALSAVLSELEPYDPADPLIVQQYLGAMLKIVEENSTEPNVVLVEKVLGRYITDAEGIESASAYWLGLLEKYKHEQQLYEDFVFTYVEFCGRHHLPEGVNRNALRIAEELINKGSKRHFFIAALRRATALLYWNRSPKDYESAVRLAIDNYEYEYRYIKFANVKELGGDRHFDQSKYETKMSNYISLPDFAINGCDFARIVVSQIDSRNIDSSSAKQYLIAIRGEAARYLEDHDNETIEPPKRNGWARLVFIVFSVSMISISVVVLWLRR